MKWRKLGRILAPDPAVYWLVSHAGPSFARPANQGDVINIYVTGRDANNRSLIGLVRFDLARNSIVDVAAEPLLSLGERGTFDENGVGYPCLVSHDSQLFMYYTGWIPTVLVPFNNDLGLAIAADGQPFKRYSRAPLLARTNADALSIGSVFVLPGAIWKMWYTCFQRWGVDATDHKHYYVIKYAESRDGLAWDRHDHIAINLADGAEYAIGRPSVAVINGTFYMWYSCRGSAYRIGFAESADGLHWDRRDGDVGIAPSGSDWDSEMICYAHVFEHNGDYYMIYNGNGYGRTGLGLAILTAGL